MNSSPRLSVLSYNIHKGRPLARRKCSINTVKQTIADSAADIILLQEVRQSAQHSHFTYLQEKLKLYGAFFLTNYQSAHGNAILSRHPLKIVNCLNLSTNALEQRGMLHATTQINEHRLNICTVHLNLGEQSRQIQCQHIIRYLNAHLDPTEPLIIGGDFNDWRQTLCRQLQYNLGMVDVHRSCYGVPGATFPAPFPLLALDRIYVRGLQPLHAEIPRHGWQSGSDHAPLIAQIYLPTKQSNAA